MTIQTAMIFDSVACGGEFEMKLTNWP